MPKVLEVENDDDKDFSELFQEYERQEGIHGFEGDRGLDDLNKVCEAIGYRGHDFKYGSSLEHFLSDNSGACEAIIEWLNEINLPQFKEELITHLNEPEESDEEDSED
jgi:hypothetical protein